MPRQPLTRAAPACAMALTVAMAIGACSSATSGDTTAPSSPGSSVSPASSPTGSSSAATSASTRTVDVSVKGTTITPPPATIPLKVGETINVVVTSDHADEVHAHGFEVEKEVKPGVPVTLELKGDVPGVYEVELHHPPLTLLQIAVS